MILLIFQKVACTAVVLGLNDLLPNNSFKPNALRSTKHMAEKACHVFGSATHVGLTQALDRKAGVHENVERFVSPPIDQLEKLRQPLTAGERLVFDLFNEGLAPEWEIYIQPHLNGLRPDFVLLNPDVGIAVFEVKDSQTMCKRRK
jgi:hypothetical protein